MRFIGKIIKTVLLCGLLLILVAVAALAFKGYVDYRAVVTETSLADMAAAIEAEENYTTLDQLPDIYLKAVVAVEDSRFYSHHGIDALALIRATIANIQSKALVQGGSTITQQLAKNLYFSMEQNLLRKATEAFTALAMEQEYGKDKILELYVNTIYFGSGYYCVYDACQGYFGKEPAEMNAYEATMLAGIPNAPSVYSLDANPDLAAQRQEQVLSAMVRCGYLSEAEAQDICNQR